MKECTKCKNSKSTIEFHKNKLKKDGLQDNCKECCKVRDQDHYVKHGNLKHLERNKKQQKTNREFVIRYKKIFCKCVDCGIKDWRVLQFDHLNNKKYNLADLGASAVSLNLIKTEIRKCEIRCANCHQIKTHHSG